MPATGHLTAMARRKYGPRADDRIKGLRRLFDSIADSLINEPTIYSDEHPYYAPLVKRYFPESHYLQSKGEKATVAGQGELKKGLEILYFVLITRWLC